MAVAGGKAFVLILAWDEDDDEDDDDEASPPSIAPLSPPTTSFAS